MQVRGAAAGEVGEIVVWEAETATGFLLRNSWRLLAFLRTSDGLSFFFLTSTVFTTLVSREKENWEPVVSVKEKEVPWLASAWQKSMHLLARDMSPLVGAVIVEGTLL